jgi:1-acyl-sn-glycerol-3-phosphate acyltransferase
MLALRSLLFNALFYTNLVVQMILWTPYYFLVSREKAWFVPKFWVRSSIWLQERAVGTRCIFEGRENLPDGPFILAPKHQSFWDAVAFIPDIPDPVIILKRSLTRIPVFGWYLAKMRMIPVDRGRGRGALRAVTALAREEMARGRQLVIFPEGTRRAPGEEPIYKWGIAELYDGLGLPVVPVAHAAGLFWPRRRFLRYPGVLRVRYLPAIPPGLSKEAFMERLVHETEAGCDRALLEAASAPNPPPLPPSAVRRLAELRGAAAAQAASAVTR